MQRTKNTKPVATSGAAVRRYFPGRTPGEAQVDLSDSESDGGQQVAATPAQKITMPALVAAHVGEADVEPRSESEQSGGADALLRNRLLARQQASSDSDSSSSSCGGSSSGRRAQARLLHQSHDIHDPGRPGDGSGAGSASDSSSSADDSDEDGEGYTLPVLLKPSFVPKSQRQLAVQGRSVVSSSSLGGGGGQAAADSADAQEHDRRAASVRKAAEEAQRARAEPPVDEPSETMVCDDDNGNVDAEFEAWRERELRRIERDKTEQAAAEQAEVERAQVQDMTEEEREAAGLARAQQQRAEKAQRVVSLAAAAATDSAATRHAAPAPAATDATARAAQEMLEHALRADKPRRGNSKWRGYQAEDTSRGTGGRRRPT
ncbi:hypothetical protein H4R19_003717 [Coemansia spiralis]|nr:hypothetical protein H4R19_003717 [Coemansia spiralis]